jgi:hypothetical protein
MAPTASTVPSIPTPSVTPPTAQIAPTASPVTQPMESARSVSQATELACRSALPVTTHLFPMEPNHAPTAAKDVPLVIQATATVRPATQPTVSAMTEINVSRVLIQTVIRQAVQFPAQSATVQAAATRSRECAAVGQDSSQLPGAVRPVLIIHIRMEIEHV